MSNMSKEKMKEAIDNDLIKFEFDFDASKGNVQATVSFDFNKDGEPSLELGGKAHLAEAVDEVKDQFFD